MKKANQKRTGWQKLRRFVVVVLVVCLSPLLVWWIFNLFDEEPSAEALRLSAQPAARVADVDNAWLAFAGIDAAADKDLIALGRRRVDAAALTAAAPAWELAITDEALFEQAVPAVRFDAQTDSTKAFCPERDTSCLDWVLTHAATLVRLREANALRLQRSASVLDLPGWQTLYPATLEAPIADFSILRLATHLIALDLARGAEQSDDGLRARALQKLARSDAFWRRVLAQPTDLISLMVASAHLEASQRLVGELFDATRRPVTPAMQPAINAILQPLAAAVDWSGALSHEYRLFEHVIHHADPGAWGTLRQCIAGTTSNGCLETLAMNSALAPQATMNLHARNQVAYLAWLGADPRHVEARRSELGEVLQKSFPDFGDTQTLLRQLSYNFAGRILASIAIPAMDYGLRVHDREALRRMIVLKRAAMSQGIADQAMPAFLAAQPDALRDPYTGEAFAWDALFHEMTFEPRASKHWKRARAGIAYSMPPMDVDACPAPFALQVTEHHGDVAGATVSYLSCGVGAQGFWVQGEHDPAVFDALQRQQSALMWQDGDEVGARVLLRDDLTLYAYEARLPADATGAIEMQALAHAKSASLTLQLSPTSESMVSLKVRNRVAAEVAREIAKAKGIEVRGVNRLGEARITLNGDWPVNDAMTVIADLNDLRLSETAPGQLTFLPSVARLESESESQ